MTYDEITEVGNEFFDEYMPKTGAKTRKAFLDAFLTELEDNGALNIDDEIAPGDDDEVPDDDVE